MFRRLRDALERALAAATPPPDLREMTAQMREAVIEQKAAVRGVSDALAQSEQLLAGERGQLETAQRRRELAAGIGDQETVAVAERFIARHAEHVAVLERKVAAQREELALAERDLAEMTTQLQEAMRRQPSETAGRSADAAWGGLGAAGMDRPETDLEGELLRSRLERAGHEAAADAKLEELKKRMGRA
jgi:hypothetical protein